MATRKEVAEYAKVSVATVSYVVNHTKNVTPEVRERVEEAIKVLNYRPNLIARGLVTKQTLHVAMFVNNLKNSYYAEMLEGAQSVASQYGYIVSIIMIDYSNQDEILQITSRGVDGVILATAKTEKLEGALDQNICCAKTGPYIDIDYRQGILDAVKSLKKHGHQNIAYLSGLKITSDPHPRLQYVLDAFQKCGITYQPELFIDGNDAEATDEEAGIEAVRKLLQSGKQFTAVLALNDLMAIGAMRELKKNGLEVPTDISVVGCDNTQGSRYFIPTLSTIDVQSFEIGKLLMLELVHLSNRKELEKKIIMASYIERESVGNVRRISGK